MASVISEIRKKFPSDRIHDQALYLAGATTDASFYHLVPKAVIDVSNLNEMDHLLRTCAAHDTSVTFRAAGTSLSGQAQGAGVIARLSRGWKKIEVTHSGEKITVEPGVIVDHANLALLPFHKKLGPDPASSQSCMMGGVAANNSSGMCCGIHQNSYQTLAGLSVLFPPRSKDSSAPCPKLDSRDSESRQSFLHENPEIIEGIRKIRAEILSDFDLCEKIKTKRLLKSTMGYALRAFLEFEDPIEILVRLMIGSEGTLGFISELTYRTVDAPPHSSAALVLCKDLQSACELTLQLQSLDLNAVELLDPSSLQSVADLPGVPSWIKQIDQETSALLIELRAVTWEKLQSAETRLNELLNRSNNVIRKEVTQNPLLAQQWWNIRKGLLPTIGKKRPPGTTLIIEDVSVPLASLAEFSMELRTLLVNSSYRDAVIYGHAKDGNLHFVFWEDFNYISATNRYSQFMAKLADLVVKRFQGSLKAEHGVGRNMAPFLTQEWGPNAVAVMRRIKNLLDPLNILNPGVIFSTEADSHLKFLKKTPRVHQEVDSCIECGFCEEVCPSKNLTLTPRQRIALSRSLSKGRVHPWLKYRQNKFLDYQLKDTCAGDGLCATRCPVGIDTGEWIKRTQNKGLIRAQLAQTLSENIKGISLVIRFFLKLGQHLRRIFPSDSRFGKTLLRLAAAPPLRLRNPLQLQNDESKRIIYFPSCVSRTIRGGPAESKPLHEVVIETLHSSGYSILIPEEVETHCCGLPFESHSFFQTANNCTSRLHAALNQLDPDQVVPVLLDTSPCALRLKKSLSSKRKVYDSVEFLSSLVKSNGTDTPFHLRKNQEPITAHIPCSVRKQGLEKEFKEIVEACTTQANFPEDVFCCGVAGDKGIRFPELYTSALSSIRKNIPGHATGISSSPTCEMGLSEITGIPYKSLFHLVSDQIEKK